MAHAREQVRSAIVTLLNTSPTAYRRAYNTRIPPMQQVWPYLMVWAESETITDRTIHPSCMQLRDMTLVVEARVQLPQRETEELENQMDDVAAEIETKLTLTTVQTALPKIESFILTDTRLELVVDQDDVPSYGAVVMNFQISYATIEGTPGTLI
jgi:hypothetical protein